MKQTHILVQSGRPPIVLRIIDAPSAEHVTIEVLMCDKIIDDDYLAFLEWAHPIMAAISDERTAVKFKSTATHHLVDVLKNLLGETKLK